MKEENNTIWTIGHSTRPLEEFMDILHSFNIELVADIRSFPGSRKLPQYNKEALEVSLPQNSIQYVHLEKLGGRRKVKPGSKNTGWRHIAFRGYADYMETDVFKKGIIELEKIALKQRTAYMCSEAVWWRCHRRIITDYLIVEGEKVFHILSPGQIDAAAMTSAAQRGPSGALIYPFGLCSPGRPEI